MVEPNHNNSKEDAERACELLHSLGGKSTESAAGTAQATHVDGPCLHPLEGTTRNSDSPNNSADDKVRAKASENPDSALMIDVTTVTSSGEDVDGEVSDTDAALGSSNPTGKGKGDGRANVQSISPEDAGAAPAPSETAKDTPDDDGSKGTSTKVKRPARLPKLYKPYTWWASCHLQKACATRGIRGFSKCPEKEQMVKVLTALDVTIGRPSPYFADLVADNMAVAVAPTQSPGSGASSVALPRGAGARGGGSGGDGVGSSATRKQAVVLC